jgi:hypothetical protein
MEKRNEKEKKLKVKSYKLQVMLKRIINQPCNPATRNPQPATRNLQPATNFLTRLC